MCSDARSLPFGDNAFDMTTSFGTLHHIWPIEEPIRELLRVTRGNIHLNEPNYFALTRAALLLPTPIKRKLKQFYLSDYSHSPYEDSINPYRLKKIASGRSAEVNLSFPKSSWISQESRGIKMLLRKINLLLLYIAPFAASHFDAIMSKEEGSM